MPLYYHPSFDRFYLIPSKELHLYYYLQVIECQGCKNVVGDGSLRVCIDAYKLQRITLTFALLSGIRLCPYVLWFLSGAIGARVSSVVACYTWESANLPKILGRSAHRRYHPRSDIGIAPVLSESANASSNNSSIQRGALYDNLSFLRNKE